MGEVFQGERSASNELTLMQREVIEHTKNWDIDHTTYQIIGSPNAGMRTRRASQNECLYGCFLSQIDPKKIGPDWIVAMQEELN